jgi:primase-polymerase (primpol)-like protein
MMLLPNGAPIAAIPEGLCSRTQWVLWREEPKPNKPDEFTKIPYTDLGRKALSNTPKGSHATVVIVDYRRCINAV